MKSIKKIISVLVIAAVIIMSVVPAFASDTDNLTFLYIDKGNITIGDKTVSGYGYFGEHITTYNPDGYCIAFSSSSVTTTTNNVVIDGGQNHILLRNIKIAVSAYFGCAFLLQNGAEVELDYTGTNTITSGKGRAGIEVSPDCTLILSGEGTLRAGSAGQAGIGGGNGNSNGTIIINSGTIVAQCNEESAGIGGGSSGNGGNIIINGGNVKATGGSSAAGIGGGCACDGGNITINGGTVTAIGGANGAGIGGGWYGEMGNVVINGGSVKAVAGSNAPAIGCGNGLQTEGGAVNSDGERVYPVKLNSSSFGTSSVISVNGLTCNVCGTHPDDSYYYLYLTQGTSFLTVEKTDNPVIINKITVSSSGSSSVSSVNPVQAENGASIGSDNIIRGISCGLTDLNDYLSVSSGFSLEYDNEFIGTGTHVDVMYGDTFVFRYITLLYGDLNNDGFYDGEDAVISVLINNGMLNRNNTDSIIIEAADADRDGYLSISDTYLLERAGLLRTTVNQGATSVTFNSDSYAEYVNLIDQTPSEAEQTDEFVQENENNFSFINFIIDLIKTIIKFFISSDSFLKNYFI